MNMIMLKSLNDVVAGVSDVIVIFCGIFVAICIGAIVASIASISRKKKQQNPNHNVEIIIIVLVIMFMVGTIIVGALMLIGGHTSDINGFLSQTASNATDSVLENANKITGGK